MYDDELKTSGSIMHKKRRNASTYVMAVNKVKEEMIEYKICMHTHMH